MALKKALEDLNNALKDLTSLHVQTFTGTMDLDVSPDRTFDKMMKDLKTAKTGNTVRLVAESLIKFDGDSYNFITDDADDVPSNGFEVHQNAVKSGLETRQALLALFKGFFKLK